MKRDWDCVRAILTMLEEQSSSTSMLQPKDVLGWDVDTVSYHMSLLEQAGLIEAVCQRRPNAAVFCLGSSLTWSGHELLENMRRPETWNRVRSVATEKGIELSLDAIKAIGAWGVHQVLSGRFQ